MAELVDAVDSKSAGSNPLSVRFRSPVISQDRFRSWLIYFHASALITSMPRLITAAVIDSDSNEEMICFPELTIENALYSFRITTIASEKNHCLHSRFPIALIQCFLCILRMDRFLSRYVFLPSMSEECIDYPGPLSIENGTAEAQEGVSGCQGSSLPLSGSHIASINRCPHVE